MTVETVRAMLGWAALINSGLVLIWFAFFVFAHEFAHRVHSRFFALSREKFDELNCLMMGIYELMILVVLLGPYLGLRILGAP